MQDFGPVMVATHDVPREVKEAAVIERRRDLERARADRIFDVKNRTIGIDTAALEAQIAAKKRVEELESERERTLDAAMIATAKQADILQQEVDRMKAVQLRDIAEYRSRNQAKTTRREYDLSDPDALKKDEIPTAHPEKLGLSSAQLFPGMDSTNDERKKLQAQQMREWCTALADEKVTRATTERDADRQYYQMQGEITSSLNVMISAHENSKKQLLFANAAENQALAEAKRMQTEEARIATSERNIAEINANLTSPFLTEDPATTVSYSNPNRPIPYHFKGLPTEYKQYILDTQMQQAHSNHQQKLAAKQDNAAWDSFMLAQNVEASKMELAVTREKERQRKELRETLKLQAEEVKVREAAAFASLTSKPDDSFFGQFGTSSR